MTELLCILKAAATTPVAKIADCREVVAAIAAGDDVRGPWRGAGVGKAEFMAQLLKWASSAKDDKLFTYRDVKRKQGKWSATDGVLIPVDAYSAKQRERLENDPYSMAQSWQQNIDRDLGERGYLPLDASTVVPIEL